MGRAGPQAARARPVFGPARARYGPGPLAITWAVGLTRLEILDFGPGLAIFFFKNCDFWTRPAVSTSPGLGQVSQNFSPARHGTSLMGHGPDPARIPLQPAGLARGQA